MKLHLSSALFGIILLLTTLGLAEPPLVLPMSPLESATLLSPGEATTLQVRQEGATYLVLHMEFKDEESLKAFSSPRMTPFHQYGRFLDVFAVPGKATVDDLSAAKGLVWIDPAGQITAPPAPKLNPVASRSLTETIVQNGLDGLTGKGVVIAIVDSGVDIRHPDFITTDSSGKPVSRFEYFWDTSGTQNANGSKAPVSYPGGASFGTVYSQKQLTAALRKEMILPLLDANGHGTACASIAAGNGQGSPAYAGAAPQATLVGVRLGSTGVENSFLVGAVLQWLENINGKRPMVVSNSWGGQYSGHDGASVIERQIDARYPPTKEGRMVLFAAGNAGSDSLHASGTFKKDVPALLSWNAPAGGQLSVYFNESNTSPVSLPETLQKRSFVHPITGQSVWQYTLPAGEGSFSVGSQALQNGSFDAYILGQGATFKDSCVSYTKLVSTPGAAGNVLTVGSYDFNSLFNHQGKSLVLGVGPEFKVPMRVGSLSSYSSPGYSRLGLLKPDVAAPGQWHTAAAPLDESVKVIRDTSGKYRLFNGTSAATPYVAGVVALMMEKDPRFSLARFRALLDKHATNDLTTGKVPNPKWGRGKLDLAAIKAVLQELGPSSARSAK